MAVPAISYNFGAILKAAYIADYTDPSPLTPTAIILAIDEFCMFEPVFDFIPEFIHFTFRNFRVEEDIMKYNKTVLFHDGRI